MRISVTSSDQSGNSNVNPVACNRGKVLIVEDEETIADLFAIVLANSFPGLSIDKVKNGDEALQQFAEHHHTLVITDVNMPHMPGHVVYRKIEELCARKIWKTPTVLFCTGQVHSAEVRSIVAGDGRHGMLTKPIDPNDLLDRVRSRLSAS